MCSSDLFPSHDRGLLERLPCKVLDKLLSQRTSDVEILLGMLSVDSPVVKLSGMLRPL